MCSSTFKELFGIQNPKFLQNGFDGMDGDFDVLYSAAHQSRVFTRYLCTCDARGGVYIHQGVSSTMMSTAEMKT